MRRGVWTVGAGYLILLCLGSLCAHAAPAADAEQPRRLAVLPLKNLRPGTDTDWIGAGASETLTTKLAGVPGLVTVERTLVAKVIEEHRFQTAGLSDPNDAVKIGKLLGVQRIVIGTYARQGDQIQFNVRVVDVETALILNTAGLTGTADKLFNLFSRLAEAVVKSFDKTVVIVDDQPVVRPSPEDQRLRLKPEQIALLRRHGTNSPAAYEAFSRGVAARTPEEKSRWWNKAIGLDPNFALAYHQRGISLAMANQHALALKDFTKTIQLAPRFSKAWYNRGVTYDILGDRTRAMDDYTKAIELSPQYARAYGQRGVLLDQLGRHAEALRDLNRAIQLDPTDPKSFNNRGYAYNKLRQHDRAIADYNVVIRRVPRLPDVYFDRACAYNRKRDHARAASDCTQAIRLKPDFAKAYRGRAIEYLHLRQYDLAWSDVRICRRLGITLDPAFLTALARASGRRE